MHLPPGNYIPGRRGTPGGRMEENKGLDEYERGPTDPETPLDSRSTQIPDSMGPPLKAY